MNAALSVMRARLGLSRLRRYTTVLLLFASLCVCACTQRPSELPVCLRASDGLIGVLA